MQTSYKSAFQQKKLVIIVILLVIISSFAVQTSPETSHAQRVATPNILLIMADDLGYGDLGSYGSEFIQTPNIDKLRQESMKFNEYYTNAPVCSPTRASLLTGQYPSRFSLRFICGQGTATGLPDTLTLPKLFKQAGYNTHHIGKWHLGADDPEYSPTGLGFDDFFGFLFANDLNQNQGYIDPRLKIDDEPYTQYTGHLTDILGDHVVDTLKEVQEPFFISYWPYAPHIPVEPPERWAAQYPDTAEGRYAALVSALDEKVGKILAELDERGLSSNTIVIFTSDNGGASSTHRHGNANLRGFKHDLFEGGIKVPFMIRWPDHITPNSEVDDVVLSFDVLPTLAEIVGLEIDPSTIDGSSFLSLLRGEPYITPYPLFWEYRNPKYGNRITYAVRDGKWKLVSEQGEKYLFDLDSDPSESVNLIDEQPEIAARFEDLYQEWRWETTPLEHTIASFEGDVTIQDELITFGPDGGIVFIDHHPKFNPDIFEFTFSTWLMQSDSTIEQDQQIAVKGDGWSLLYTPDNRLKLSIERRSGKATVITSNTQMSPKTWHHIVFTFTHREQLSLYIDGQLDISTTPYLIIANKEPVIIGNNSAQQAPFSGSIYDLRFFNAGLTAAEISVLANSPPVVAETP